MARLIYPLTESVLEKADLNAAYDQLRSSDPNKAAVEGMKMHKAYFGKP